MEIHSKMSEHCRFISHYQDVNISYFKRTHCEEAILQTVPSCEKKEQQTPFNDVKDTEECTAYQEVGYLEHLEKNQIAVSAVHQGVKVKAMCNDLDTKQADEYLENKLKKCCIAQLEETTQEQGTARSNNLSNSQQFADLGISLRKPVLGTAIIPDCPIDLKEKHKQNPSKQNEEKFISVHEKPTSISLNVPSRLVKVKKVTQIGRGTFGRCYLGINAESGAELAIKEIPFNAQVKDRKPALEDTRTEFSLLKGLCHPNIIRVQWATFDEDIYHIVMEYMPGGSVGGLLQLPLNENGLKESLNIRYTKRVLHGLSYLHSRKILHRDIKGENLLLTGNGLDLKIGDFGSATKVGCIINGVKENPHVGTVPFMAPEVGRENSYTGAGDVWSVGCCIIQMATAKRPWNADNFDNKWSLLYKIGTSSDPPPIPHRLSPSLKGLTESCLKMNKEVRPSAEELLKNDLFIESRENGYPCVFEMRGNVHETM